MLRCQWLKLIVTKVAVVNRTESGETSGCCEHGGRYGHYKLIDFVNNGRLARTRSDERFF